MGAVGLVDLKGIFVVQQLKVEWLGGGHVVHCNTWTLLRRCLPTLPLCRAASSTSTVEAGMPSQWSRFL